MATRSTNCEIDWSWFKLTTCGDSVEHSKTWLASQRANRTYPLNRMTSVVVLKSRDNGRCLSQPDSVSWIQIFGIFSFLFNTNRSRILHNVLLHYQGLFSLHFLAKIVWCWTWHNGWWPSIHMGLNHLVFYPYAGVSFEESRQVKAEIKAMFVASENQDQTSSA